MRRCRARHPAVAQPPFWSSARSPRRERCELPAGHTERHQLIGGRTWKRGKAAQALYSQTQQETNERHRAKCKRRLRRFIKELGFQDLIRSEATMARYMRCAG